MYSAFFMFSWLPYFNPKLFVFFCIWLLVLFLMSSPQLVGNISFRCFGMSCFFLCCFTLSDIVLIFLLLQVFSGLFPQVILLFFRMLPFSFCPYMFQHFSFVSLLFPVFADFFICISSQISHPGFNFFSVLFKRILIFSQTNFAPV